MLTALVHAPSGTTVLKWLANGIVWEAEIPPPLSTGAKPLISSHIVIKADGSVVPATGPQNDFKLNEGERKWTESTQCNSFGSIAKQRPRKIEQAITSGSGQRSRITHRLAAARRILITGEPGPARADGVYVTWSAKSEMARTTGFATTPRWPPH